MMEDALKKGDKVSVSYFEADVPQYCYYKGPGVFLKHLKPPHDWGSDAMCIVDVPKQGKCYFPLDSVFKEKP